MAPCVQLTWIETPKWRRTTASLDTIVLVLSNTTTPRRRLPLILFYGLQSSFLSWRKDGTTLWRSVSQDNKVGLLESSSPNDDGDTRVCSFHHSTIPLLCCCPHLQCPPFQILALCSTKSLPLTRAWMVGMPLLQRIWWPWFMEIQASVRIYVHGVMPWLLLTRTTCYHLLGLHPPQLLRQGLAGLVDELVVPQRAFGIHLQSYASTRRSGGLGRSIISAELFDLSLTLACR